MPLETNELSWAVHDREWSLAALVLEGMMNHGCVDMAQRTIMVRSPGREECDRLRSPNVRDMCFKIPHTTVLHMLAQSRPGDRDLEGWNAYERVWDVAAAVLHDNPAIDARMGTAGSGGKTPLMIAAMQNNSSAMNHLLRAGAGGLRRVRD